MKNALSKFRSNLDATRQDEAGDIVQTILIIAVFVVIVVIVGKMLYDTITERAESTGNCIAGVGTGGGSGTGSIDSTSC